MKRTKVIIILSTIAIFGTASIIYYYYRRNKTLLNEVKELKRNAWCEKHKISESDNEEHNEENVIGDNANSSVPHQTSQVSLNSLRNEIASLEGMISSSEEDTDSSSDEDVNSEALLKDILGENPYQTDNHVEVIEPEINPLHSYHLDENEDNDNLELSELVGGETNKNIENLVQENISKAVVNISPQQSEKDNETIEDVEFEEESVNEDTVSSNIIEISNMSSQSSIISNTLTLEMKINILIDKYTKKNLEALCINHKISKSGSKRVVIKRLLDNNYNFNLNQISKKTQQLNKN